MNQTTKCFLESTLGLQKTPAEELEKVHQERCSRSRQVTHYIPISTAWVTQWERELEVVLTPSILSRILQLVFDNQTVMERKED